MANRNKRIGTQFETDIVNFVHAGGPNGTHIIARRLGQTGLKDIGDVELHGRHYYATLQAKDWANFDLAGWVDDMEEQCANAGTDFGFVVAKRRRKNISKAYVITTLEQMRNYWEETL